MQNKPITLFLVPSLARAGAEKQVVDLANGLAGEGFGVHLASFEDNRDQLVRVDQAQVSYHELRRGRKFEWGLVRRLASLIDRENIDVLHCTLSIAIFYGVLAARLSRTRPAVIAGVHTTLSRNRKDELLERWLYRWQIRSTSRVVFVCHNQKEHWWRRDPRLKDMSEVIYNGVDMDHFDPRKIQVAATGLREELGIPTDAIVLCCIAAFRPEKAQGNILEAMAGLPRGGQAEHLILAGEGPERSRVMERAKALGMADRVHFLGSIPDVRPVLGAADFSVISSTAVETFSFAMLESMSMETPVLSSRIGGAAEAVIPGETGYLAEPGDIAGLRAAMGQLLTDREKTRELGRRARRKVEEMFSLETMLRDTAQLIENVHNRRLS